MIITFHDGVDADLHKINGKENVDIANCRRNNKNNNKKKLTKERKEK